MDQLLLGLLVGKALKVTLETFMPEVSVETTHSSEEAIKIIRKDDFELIITDLKMPGDSGLSFVEQVSRYCSNK